MVLADEGPERGSLLRCAGDGADRSYRRCGVGRVGGAAVAQEQGVVRLQGTDQRHRPCGRTGRAAGDPPRLPARQQRRHGQAQLVHRVRGVQRTQQRRAALAEHAAQAAAGQLGEQDVRGQPGQHDDLPARLGDRRPALRRAPTPA